MRGDDYIEAHREEILRRWADNPRHSWIGLHAEYAAARDLEGIVLDEEGREVPSIFAMAEEVQRPTRHPAGGANRKARRAAEAKRRRA